MRKRISSFPILSLIALFVFAGFSLASWSRRVWPTIYARGEAVDTRVSRVGSQNLKGGSFSVASSAAPALWQTLSLNALHNWPSAAGNNIKVFDAAVDETRNRIYVQGILTGGIAVIDGQTDTLVGSLASGIGDDNYHLTYLAVHPTSGDLYIADASHQTLRRLDPITNTVSAGPVTLSDDPVFILPDSAANRIYVSLRHAHKVAVYDASTLALVTEIDVAPASPQGMALDNAAHRLYVVDARRSAQATHARLLIIDTATLQQATPVVFTNTSGHPINFVDRDPSSGDLFVTTPEELFRIGSDGAQRWLTSLPDNAKEPIYRADTGKVYVVSRNGISKIRSALAVIDADTGALEKTLDLQTGGAQWIAFDAATGKLYTPGMEYTEVAVVDTNAVSVLKTIDIGNAVEDIAIAPDDGTAYFANRLGGSTIIAYRPDTGAWNEFTAGGWPTAVDVDPGLNRLFVLSHYAGTLSAYDLTDPLAPNLLAAAPLGLNDVTDAISNQIVDATHHRVITTHPEHDSIVIMDGQSLTVTATISDVPSFTYDPAVTKGRGHLQPAVDEALNKLYVLAEQDHQRKVDVFDGANGYAYLHTIDLSGLPWDTTFNDFLIWADNGRHRLYVGINIFDTTTDTLVGRLPKAAGQVVVGLDAAQNRLYTAGLDRPSRQAGRLRGQRVGGSAPMLHLYVLDRDTYAVQTQADLRSQTYAPPSFALDVGQARFFAGYMQSADVDIYALNGAPTPTPSPTPGSLYLPILLH